METQKQCYRCKEFKDRSNYSKHTQKKDGLRPTCKLCEHDDIYNYSKTYRLANKEKYCEYSKNWAKNNPEKIKDIGKDYRKRNPDKIKTLKSKSQKTEKGKIGNLRRNNKRRALKLSLTHPDHDLKIETAMYELISLKTKETGKSYELDHIYPLNKGGPHHHENLQIIEAHLNNMKQDRLYFYHPDVRHWRSLPQHLLNWIKENKNKPFN